MSKEQFEAFAKFLILLGVVLTGVSSLVLVGHQVKDTFTKISFRLWFWSPNILLVFLVFGSAFVLQHTLELRGQVVFGTSAIVAIIAFILRLADNRSGTHPDQEKSVNKVGWITLIWGIFTLIWSAIIELMLSVKLLG